MQILAANNASSKTELAITPSSTTLQLVAGGGAKFESPEPGLEYFVGTLSDKSGVLNEIVHVTERVGDVLTIVRAQEDTVAQSWPAKTSFANLITAGSLKAMFGSVHDPINIISLHETTQLTAADSGNTYDNDGTLVPLDVKLPINAPVGTHYTILSAVDLVGIGFTVSEPGVFISFDGQMGTAVLSYTKGGSCEIIRTTESEWMVKSASPRTAWFLRFPTDADFSPEILAWREAVRSSDKNGEPATSTMIAYDQFIHSHKHFGTWTKIVDCVFTWNLEGENSAVALTSLKLRLQLQLTNGAVISNGQGVICDGESMNVLWPAIPAVYGPPVMTPVDQHVEIYTIFVMGKNAQAIGTSSGPGASLPSMSIRPLQNGLMRINFGSRTADFTLPFDPITGNAIGGGLSSGNRVGSTVIEGYKNGVFLGAINVLPMTDGMSSAPINLGSNNNGLIANNFLNCAIGYAAFGARFTAEEEANNWTILSRLIARYGAQPFDPTDEDEEDE
jgi:hypothetical protein